MCRDHTTKFCRWLIDFQSIVARIDEFHRRFPLRMWHLSLHHWMQLDFLACHRPFCISNDTNNSYRRQRKEWLKICTLNHSTVAFNRPGKTLSTSSISLTWLAFGSFISIARTFQSVSPSSITPITPRIFTCKTSPRFATLWGPISRTSIGSLSPLVPVDGSI